MASGTTMVSSNAGFREENSGNLEMGPDLISRTKERLEAEFYRMNDDWLEGCVQFYVSTPLPNPKNRNELLKFVKEQWLLSDLREISNERGSLPPNLTQHKSILLPNTYILQMEVMYDISRSKYEQLEEIRNNRAAKGKPLKPSNIESTQDPEEKPKSRRMMSLKLTDGVQEITGMEYKQIKRLNETLLPGSKLMIIGPVRSRRGVLLLEEKNVKSVGGEVDRLLVSNASENVFARALGFPENPDPYNDAEQTKAQAEIQEVEELNLTVEDFEEIDFAELEQRDSLQQSSLQRDHGAKSQTKQANKCQNKDERKHETRDDRCPMNLEENVEMRDEQRRERTLRETEDVVELSDFEYFEEEDSEVVLKGERKPMVTREEGRNDEKQEMDAWAESGNDGNHLEDIEIDEFFEDLQLQAIKPESSRQEAVKQRLIQSNMSNRSPIESDMTSAKREGPKISETRSSRTDESRAKTEEPETGIQEMEDFTEFFEDIPEPELIMLKPQQLDSSTRKPEVVGKSETIKSNATGFKAFKGAGNSNPPLRSETSNENIPEISAVVRSKSKPVAFKQEPDIWKKSSRPEVSGSSKGKGLKRNLTMDSFLRKKDADDDAVRILNEGEAIPVLPKAKRVCDTPVGSSPKRGRKIQVENPSDSIESEFCNFIANVQERKAGEEIVRGKTDEIGRLGKKENLWTLEARISDGTGSLDVSFSNEVLEKMLGFSVQEFSRKKKLKNDPKIEHELRMSLRGTEQKLRNLDALLKLKFSLGNPCVIEVIDLTEDQKLALQRKLKYYLETRQRF